MPRAARDPSAAATTYDLLVVIDGAHAVTIPFTSREDLRRAYSALSQRLPAGRPTRIEHEGTLYEFVHVAYFTVPAAALAEVPLDAASTNA